MTDPKKPARWPLVSLLVFCGGISVTLSEVHAYDKMKEGSAAGLVAFLVGIAPVVAAAMLAHLLADAHVAGWLKAGVGLVFVGAMMLSVDAQAATVKPIVGEKLAIVFPLVLDLSTIVALLALAGVGRKPTRGEMPPDSARETLPETVPAVVVERSPERPEMPPRPVVQPAIEAVAGPLVQPVVDGAPVATADRSESGRPEPQPTAETTAPRPPERPVEPPAAEPGPAPQSPARPPRKRSRRGGDNPMEGMSTRDRARLELMRNPEMTGADLARLLHISPERGRTLAREIRTELDNAPQAGPVASVADIRSAIERQ